MREVEPGRNRMDGGGDAASSFGQAALNAGARVIATPRSKQRFAMLEGLGAERVELEGPDLSKRIAEAPRKCRKAAHQLA